MDTFIPGSPGAATHTQVGSDHVVLDEVPFAPPSFEQLGVLVLDGSGSMTLDAAEADGTLDGVVPARSKAVAVDSAVRGLVTRLAGSRKASGFSLALVAFSDGVLEERLPRPVREIDPSESFDPTARGSGGTRMSTGLEAAERIVTTFIAGAAAAGVPRSAVVVAMSDGEDGAPTEVVAAAARLRSIANVSVAAALFATKGHDPVGGRLLEAIVSQPRLYQTVYSAEQLREFFLSSITATAASGVTGGRS